MNVFDWHDQPTNPNVRPFFREDSHWHYDRRRNGFNKAEILLGNDRYGKPIMYWENYGVVCPDSITTNGSIIMVMRYNKPAYLTGYGVAFLLNYALYSLRRSLTTDIPYPVWNGSPPPIEKHA